MVEITRTIAMTPEQQLSVAEMVEPHRDPEGNILRGYQYDVRGGRVMVKEQAHQDGTLAHVTYQHPHLNCPSKGPLLTRAGAEQLIKSIRAIFPEERPDGEPE